MELKRVSHIIPVFEEGLRQSRLVYFVTCFLVLGCQSISVKANQHQLPIWSSLTDFEVNTLENLSRAQAGDPEAILQLYVLASGDVRREAQFRKIQKKLNDWSLEHEGYSNADGNSSNLWQKGYKLHRAMHKDFFLGGNLEESAGKGYDFEQSRLSQTLRDKTFNCVSASLLYSYLSLYSGLQLQAVMLPSHVFIQLDLGDNQWVEVETTSATGYDWVHDEAFYKEQASADWFQSRGLSPSSYEDYLNREFLSAYELGVQNLVNQHTAPDRMAYKDRMRLQEIYAVLNPQNLQAQKVRLGFYLRENARFSDKSDYPSIAKMYETLAEVIPQLRLLQGQDPELDNLLGWFESYQAVNQMQQGNSRLAYELSLDSLQNLPQDVQDRKKIINNLLLAAVSLPKQEMAERQFEQAKESFQQLSFYCEDSDICQSQIHNLYAQWAAQNWQMKQWPQVVQVIDEYLSVAPDDAQLESFQSNMQSAYLNWSLTYSNQGDWLGASSVLQQCTQESPQSEECYKRLNELKRRHRLD